MAAPASASEIATARPMPRDPPITNATRLFSNAIACAPYRIDPAGPPCYPFRSKETPMPRLGFGAFLAPHHPIGENPTLQFRRDLKFVEHLDELGYDEFWCGEHHSSGWEMIASPEMFLAAAGERTKRIKLGTGVISLPYHHPYNVAQRMVQLDHMTGGRAIFGSGPGALPSDAHTLGIDPMVQRDRQDDAIGVIRRLFKGERVTKKTDWYTLQDAALQLLPLQEDMPFAVASQISPSGMTLAGKYGIGIISLGSMSDQGLLSLPTQWGFADGAASTIGTPDDLVKTIKDVLAKSGGFGTVIGFVHDWANPENTMRSWDMVARYVIPEINGYVAKLRESQKFLIDNRAVFDRAGQAIMAKIMENKDAAEALKLTDSPRFAAASASVPKFEKDKQPAK